MNNSLPSTSPNFLCVSPLCNWYKVGPIGADQRKWCWREVSQDTGWQRGHVCQHQVTLLYWSNQDPNCTVTGIITPHSISGIQLVDHYCNIIAQVKIFSDNKFWCSQFWSKAFWFSSLLQSHHGRKCYISIKIKTLFPSGKLIVLNLTNWKLHLTLCL